MGGREDVFLSMWFSQMGAEETCFHLPFCPSWLTLLLQASYLAAGRAAFDISPVALADLPGLEPAPVKSVAEKVLGAQAETMDLGVGWGGTGKQEDKGQFP